MHMLKKLGKKQLNVIELEIQHPSWSIGQLSEATEIPYQTLYMYKHSPCYMEELDRRLHEEWRDAAKIAKAKMLDLLENGRDEVAFNASKYVLDNTGFKAAEQVDINANVQTIKVTITEDEGND